MIRVRIDFTLDRETAGLAILDAIGNLSDWLTEMFEGHDTSLWSVETELWASGEGE